MIESGIILNFWYKEQMELYKELPKPISEPKIVEDLFKDFESVTTVAFSKNDRDWQMYKNMAKEAFGNLSQW